jgi:hypothetical protein
MGSTSGIKTFIRGFDAGPFPHKHAETGFIKLIVTNEGRLQAIRL